METVTTTNIYPKLLSDGYMFKDIVAEANRVETKIYESGSPTARVVLRSGKVAKLRKLDGGKLDLKIGMATQEFKRKAGPFIKADKTEKADLQSNLAAIAASTRIDNQDTTIPELMELPLVDYISLTAAVNELYS